MTNDAAADIRRSRPASALPLYVSVQVETAWGKLGKQGSYTGIDQDLRDFPFVNVLGLSSYPYLGGFTDPDQIPLDYYTRVRGARPLPVMVVEGGWPSASVRGMFSSSPEMQARYIARQSKLLDEANALAVFQLSFADLDLGSFPKAVARDIAALRDAWIRRFQPPTQAGAHDVGQDLRATIAALNDDQCQGEEQ